MLLQRRRARVRKWGPVIYVIFPLFALYLSPSLSLSVTSYSSKSQFYPQFYLFNFPPSLSPFSLPFQVYHMHLTLFFQDFLETNAFPFGNPLNCLSNYFECTAFVCAAFNLISAALFAPFAYILSHISFMYLFSFLERGKYKNHY
jgi:hypothetical protein